MELFFRRGITFGAAVIVVNCWPAMMPPVMLSGVPMPVVGSLTPVSVRRAILMTPVEFRLETVHRLIVVMVALGIITATMAPVKFANSRFIPFFKMAGAIPMTFAAPFALGP